MRRQSHGLAQAHWGLVDQAVSAGTNLALAVVVARSTTAAEFGAFSLVYGLYIVAVPLVRSSGATVLAIEHAASTPDDLRRAVRDAASYAVGVGTLLGGAIVLAAAAAGGSLAAALLVLGVTFPALLLQDMWRGTFLAQGRPKAALANDLVWAVVMASMLWVVLAGGVEPEVWSFVAAWSTGGVAGAVAGAVALQVLPRPRSPRRWLARHRSMALPLLVGELLTQLPPHATYLLLPVVSDLGELGVLRGTYLLFGPLGLLYQAVGALALPDAVRLADPVRVHRLAVRLTGAMVTASLVWGAAVVLCPDEVGRALLGASWGGSDLTRLLLAASLVAEALMVGPRVVLGAWREPHRLLRGRLLSAPVVLVTGLALGAVFGAPGAAAGFALGYLLAAAVGWWQVRVAAAERIPSLVRLRDGAR